MWQRLLSAHGSSPEAWLECLLDLLRRVPDSPAVKEAVLVLGPANSGPFQPVALWPAGAACSPELMVQCERALGLRLPVQQTQPRALLAVPVMADSDVLGVLGLCFEGQVLPPHALSAIRLGLGWLQQTATGDTEASRLETLYVTLDLLLIAVGERRAADAAQHVATETARRLGCDRVAIGFGEGSHIRLAAFSHVADFGKRIDLVHALEAAMNESADQGASLSVESGEHVLELQESEGAQRYFTTREHARLIRDFGSAAVLSVPFYLDNENYGVFLYEWPDIVMDEDARHLADHLPPVLGRLLLDKRAHDLPLRERARRWLRQEWRKLIGAYHAQRKLAALALVLVVIFFAVASGEYRINAKSTLEGSVRRVVVAPFDGYIALAQKRAGQVVAEGDELATLDDRDMRLETMRWMSQQQQFTRQAQDAEAQQSLAQIQISMAQTRQAEAQRELAESMVQRSRIVAPFAGIIVSGDLSQSLGSAVKKGQTLFEIAPLDSYRVILEVDETDITQVRENQSGRLVLAALPGEAFPFRVSLVTPVATARDGRNFFRVEAILERGSDKLRPGIEGVGKISVGDRKLIWIWTHRLFDWLQLKLWAWFGL